MGLSGSVKQLKGLIIISKGLEEKLRFFLWGLGVGELLLFIYSFTVACLLWIFIYWNIVD